MNECRPLHGGRRSAAGGAGARQRADAARRHGKAVQVDPIKLMLKPPAFKRLKLKYDEPLSIFSFNFYVRCYTMVKTGTRRCKKAAERALKALANTPGV